MPDFLKKASRRVKAVSEPDEVGRAALFCRPGDGEDAKRLGAPGGAIGKVSRFADEADPAAIEGAADARSSIAGRNVVLVLTDRRLLAFGHGTYSGRVKDLVGDVPLADIAAMDLDAPPIGERGAATLTITFTDGASVVLTPGSRRRRFVEAFAELQGSPA